MDELGSYLAARIHERFGSEVDVVIGLPTLGLSIAGIVAQGLGHGQFFLPNFDVKMRFIDRE